MRIHHLNCGCMCPLGGKLLDGFSPGLTAQLACHCLLIETDSHGLVLVDTGFGTEDMAHRGRRLSPFFRLLDNIQYDRRYTAVEHIRALGFAPDDVRHIVLTHLDFDHAGGLDDFPQARVHVMQEEMDAARAQSSVLGRQRYRLAQWQKVKEWRFYRAGGEPWFGFQAVHGLDGLPPELLLIPLRGHTHGHAGVAVEADSYWLLHAGDAYFYREEVAQLEPHCTPGLRLYQYLMEVDRTARMSNLQRLWALSVERRDEVRLFCSHDVKELERLQQASRAGERRD